MEWLNFRHLYSFWMVHKKGSFQKASEAMFVSQSTVSEQVKSLEDYLQKDLFERLPRTLKLTDAGLDLLSYAEDIFSKSREINRFVRDREIGDKKVTLRVGITGSISRNLLYGFFGTSLLNDAIASFEIVGSHYNELAKACENFEIDFFISDEPPVGKSAKSLMTKVLFKSPVVLVGKKRIVSKIEKGTSEEIDLYRFKHQLIEDSIISDLESKYDVKFNEKIVSDDISLLRFFANSGKGVSLIPEVGAHEDLLKSQVIKLQFNSLRFIDFYVNSSKKRQSNPMIQEILSEDNLQKINQIAFDKF